MIPRGLWLALAAIALVARIMAPPGTMVEHTASGTRLVLCNGHGPVSISHGVSMPMSGLQKPARPAKSQATGGCEFAAHAAHALTTTDLEPVGHSISEPTVLPQPIVLATTGSGLAAPPPPSHAPPPRLA